MIVSIITLVLMAAYGLLIYTAGRHWQKLPDNTVTHLTTKTADELTLVIACRNIVGNEAVWLAENFQSKQTVLPKEVILVDDHSTDNTIDFLHILFREISNMRILESPYPQGKKNALRYGVEEAQTPYILCSDIDIQPHSNWIASVIGYLQQNSTDMLILPVYIPHFYIQNLSGEMQALEYAALQTLTGGMAACEHPIMCAGANLAFRRNRWLESLPDIHSEIPSGDDMFMLHSFKHRKLKISFLKSQDACVWIFPSENLRTLFRQRTRWTSKATAYTDFDTLAAGSIILLTNLWMIVLFILMLVCVFASIEWFRVHYPWSSVNMFLFIAALLLKYVIDASFLHRVKNFFGLTKVWSGSYILSFAYPLYTLITIIGAFFRQKKW